MLKKGSRQRQAERQREREEAQRILLNNYVNIGSPLAVREAILNGLLVELTKPTCAIEEIVQ